MDKGNVHKSYCFFTQKREVTMISKIYFYPHFYDLGALFKGFVAVRFAHTFCHKPWLSSVRDMDIQLHPRQTIAQPPTINAENAGHPYCASRYCQIKTLWQTRNSHSSLTTTRQTKETRRPRDDIS